LLVISIFSVAKVSILSEINNKMTKKVMFYLVFCHFVINFAVEMETMIAGYEMKKLSARTYRNGSAEILSCTYA